MAYEWKFKPRPYSDEEAKKLLAPVIDAETTDWHYNTHQMQKLPVCWFAPGLRRFRCLWQPY